MRFLQPTAVSITLSPRGWNILGGAAVLVAGACLEPTDNITCIIGGVEVQGSVRTSLLALCMSPPLSAIGRMELQLIVRSANGTVRSQGTAEFVARECDVAINIFCVKPKVYILLHMLPPIHTIHSNLVVSFDDSPGVVYDTPTIRFAAGDAVVLTWLPNDVFPLEDPESYTVDITLFCFNVASPPTSKVLPMMLASNISNSGSAELIMPNIDIVFDVGVVSFQVTVSLNSQLCLNMPVACTAGIWAPFSYFIVSAILRAACEIWCASQPEGIGERLLGAVLPCPPTMMQAVADANFEMENPFIARFFHPGAASCFREVVA